MNNCKNCGAPLTGSYCEYCGTYYGNKELDDYRLQEVLHNLERERVQVSIDLQTEYMRNLIRQQCNCFRP